MIEELKSLRATCDRCGATKEYAAKDCYLPKGWTGRSREVVYGSGYYDHCTETEHLCESCTALNPVTT